MNQGSPEKLSLVIANNIISGNSCGNTGGGINIRVGDPNIINNTIVGNKSAADTGSGLSLGGTSTRPLIINNIVLDNRPGFGITALTLEAEPILAANNVWRNGLDGFANFGGTLTDPNGADNHQSADPIFVDPGFWEAKPPPEDEMEVWVQGDYRIGWLSPCRDNAQNCPLAPKTDIQGMARPIFGGIDIGAFELHIYDLTATGSVDLSDMLFLASNWLLQGSSIPGDLNFDNVVNYLDISLLAPDYLQD
jgi:hypothetical protein